MQWKLTDHRPIYLQLAEQLTQRILAGAYPPGGRIPAVRELAAEAGVNPNTMQRALSRLEDQRLVVTNRTSGRTVTENTQAISRVREQQAKDLAKQYVAAMETLGYGPQDAAQFLQKGGKDDE